MKLNVESDEILYRAAAGHQKIGYNITTAKGTKALPPGICKTKIVKFYKTKGKKINIDYTLESYVVHDAPYIAIRTIDNMVMALLTLPNITSARLWLSPSDHSNFRYSRANLIGQLGVGYKAGRPNKPVLLKPLRNRLIEKWGAEEIQGFEADDALAIYQTEDTIAVHIDKDINMIAGEHYNHVTKEFYFVPHGLGKMSYDKGKLNAKGLIFFYVQLLTGDSTDNIPGIYGIGNYKAYDMLKGCKTEAECFKIVYNRYKEYYKEYAYEALCEISDLIWICKRRDETGSQYLINRGFLNE